MGSMLQIIGGGCPKCQKLAARVEEVAQNMGIEYTLVKVQTINEIVSFGVSVTPAFAIDGVVKSEGRVPGVEQIRKMIEQEIQPL